MNSFYSSADRLLQYAFWLLGRRDYTESEMTAKLNKRVIALVGQTDTSVDQAGVSAELVARTMDRLRELGYLNDRAFAERFAQKSLTERSRGAFWVRQQLQKKGVPSDIVNETLGLLDRDAVFEACLRAAEAKMMVLTNRAGRDDSRGIHGTNVDVQMKLKQALFRFLAGRGFDLDVVKKTIARLTVLVIFGTLSLY